MQERGDRSDSRAAQAAQPNAPLFHDGEPARPVVPSTEQSRNLSARVWRWRQGYAKQHDAAIESQTMTPSELAKILVERQKDTRLLNRALEDRHIRTSRTVHANPSHIVAFRAKGVHGTVGEILVGQEPHDQAVAAG